jgi:hypothetical protein
VLEPEPGQAVAVLHDDDGNGRARQNLGELAAVPVHPGPGLTDHLAYGQPALRRAQHDPASLAFQVVFLVR